MAKNKLNKVSIVMGSQSDYKTMIFCQNILKKLKWVEVSTPLHPHPPRERSRQLDNKSY